MDELGSMLSEHGLMLQEYIGRGASGRVYRATDIRTGNRQVAVKVFDAIGDYGLQSLSRELDAAANLRHDNIITLYRANTASEPRFLVLELADKEPLRLPLSLSDTVACGIQLCSALALAHESGIVHSDIKPHNILWRNGRRPLLSDFGSAKIDAITRHRSGIGYQPEWSPLWMNDPAAANEASDLWSLAATIGWLHWQQRPHDMDWGGAEPSKLADIIQDVLQANGGDTPPTATTRGAPLEFGRRLQQLQHDRGWPVVPFPSPHDAESWTSRTVTSGRATTPSHEQSRADFNIGPAGARLRPIRIMVAAAAAAAILGAAWFIRDTWTTGATSRGADQGQAVDVATAGEPTEQASGVTVPSGATESDNGIDPDAAGSADLVDTGSDTDGGQTGIDTVDPSEDAGPELFVFASDRGGDLDLFIRDQQGDISILLDRPEDDYNPSLSPDGKQVVFESRFGGTRSVYVAPVDGSSEPRRLSPEGAEAIEPDWSPDGSRIAWVSRERSNWDIALYERDEGTVALVTTSSSDERNPAWSADGSTLAFRSDRSGSGDIYLLDVDSGAVRRLTESPFQEDNPGWLDNSEVAYEVLLDGDVEVFSTAVNGGDGPVRRTDRAGYDGNPAYLGDQLVVVRVNDGASSIVVDPGVSDHVLDSSFGTIQGLEIGRGSVSPGSSG